MPGGASEEFKRESIKDHGRVLTGERAHWCPDWDYMTVDETCAEIVGCCCFGILFESPSPGSDAVDTVDLEAISTTRPETENS